MSDSVKLRQERANVVEQMRELHERAEKDNRDLSGEEKASWDKGQTDLETYSERIERAEMVEREAAAGATRIGPGGGDAPETNEDEPDDKAKRAAFFQALRGRTTPEQRALVEDSDGDILVPEDLDAELIREIGKITVVRDLASARTTTRDRVRRRSFGELTVGWGKLETSEGTLSESMPSTPGEDYVYVEDLFGEADIGEDELDDSDVALEAYVADSFGRALGEAEDTGFIIGAGHGSNQPEGILDGATVTRVPAAQDGAITADDLIKVEYAVPAQYAANGSWVMARTTEYQVAVLKDQDDNYIWRQGLTEGSPSLLRGRPLFNQDDVPAIPGTGYTDDVAIFGDFRAGYQIVDRSGTRLRRLDELEARSGLVVFIVKRRVSGYVRRANALRVLSVPSS